VAKDRVVFTSGSADRIAKVVRRVEAGNRDATGYVPSPRLQGGGAGKVFRVCTFTGSWSVGSSKTVTFKNQTATPNTASASNLFWPVPDGPQRDCAIAKDGTAWYLLVPQMYAADFATATTITTTAIEFKTLPGVAMATSGTAVFTIDISTCATATA
jgi:hypothetical protein